MSFNRSLWLTKIYVFIYTIQVFKLYNSPFRIWMPLDWCGFYPRFYLMKMFHYYIIKHYFVWNFTSEHKILFYCLIIKCLVIIVTNITERKRDAWSSTHNHREKNNYDWLRKTYKKIMRKNYKDIIGLSAKNCNIFEGTNGDRFKKRNIFWILP